MCEACGKGNFRLPGARITSVFKITGEHNTLFPNAVQTNVYFSLSGDFFLKCLAWKLLLVKQRKRLNRRTITSKLGSDQLFVESTENKPLTPSMYIMVIVPCTQQNFRYWVLQQQPKAEENLITLQIKVGKVIQQDILIFLIIPNSRTLLFINTSPDMI